LPIVIIQGPFPSTNLNQVTGREVSPELGGEAIMIRSLSPDEGR
jgi:hypothetical protein